MIDEQDLPITAPGALGRFLFAYMGDVDLRQRWRVAHALRRLARLGEETTIAETVALYDRVEERTFRARQAPFYWLAARLWLVIALDRIAEEAPEVVSPHGEALLEICLDNDFPHLLVRDYAADACRKLIAGGYLQLSAAQTAKLERVNKGLPPTKTDEVAQVRPFDFHQWGEGSRRFHFDGLDTLRYWYDGWLSVFEDLTPDTFSKLRKIGSLTRGVLQASHHMLRMSLVPSAFRNELWNSREMDMALFQRLNSIGTTWNGMQCGALQGNCSKLIVSGWRRTLTMTMRPSHIRSPRVS